MKVRLNGAMRCQMSVFQFHRFCLSVFLSFRRCPSLIAHSLPLTSLPLIMDHACRGRPWPGRLIRAARLFRQQLEWDSTSVGGVLQGGRRQDVQRAALWDLARYFISDAFDLFLISAGRSRAAVQLFMSKDSARGSVCKRHYGVDGERASQWPLVVFLRASLSLIDQVKQLTFGFLSLYSGCPLLG